VEYCDVDNILFDLMHSLIFQDEETVFEEIDELKKHLNSRSWPTVENESTNEGHSVFYLPRATTYKYRQ
jgi:hypothetical protein